MFAVIKLIAMLERIGISVIGEERKRGKVRFFLEFRMEG